MSLAYRSHDSTARMSLLVENGASIDVRNTTGSTVLHIACRDFSRESALSIVRLGGQLSALNNAGQTPLELITTSYNRPASDIPTTKLSLTKDWRWVRRRGFLLFLSAFNRRVPIAATTATTTATTTPGYSDED